MDIKQEIEVGFGDTAVLEFHLTGIQHSIKKAIQMRAGGLNALIDEEITKCWTEERIKQAIAVRVEEEFQASMRYGEGYHAIRKIVSEQVVKTLAKLNK